MLRGEVDGGEEGDGVCCCFLMDRLIELRSLWEGEGC